MSFQLGMEPRDTLAINTLGQELAGDTAFIKDKSATRKLKETALQEDLFWLTLGRKFDPVYLYGVYYASFSPKGTKDSVSLVH